MSKSHKIYFGAGPAALPQSVLEATAGAVLDYEGSGISLLSIAHREPPFLKIIEEASALVLQLTGLSAGDYEVLWLQGGGRQQFAMVPQNFLGDGETAGYIDSGHWAHEAMETANVFGNVVVLSSSAADKYTRLPQRPREIPAGLKYVHMTTNNTIYGTQWQEIPECSIPLIADMSSDVFSQSRDWSRFALFYAVAQKNLGPAGVTLVVVRKDILSEAVRPLPDAYSYAAQAAAKSLLNTPPVAAIYSCLLVLRWIAERGMQKIERDNVAKAHMLYDAIDRSDLFRCPVAPESRSRMNVVFTMKNQATEKSFLDFATTRGIEGIKGHRSVGGFRASLYNAVSLEDVTALTDAMRTFEQQYSTQRHEGAGV